jgi:16S rRNA (cytosine1402-N4)-methyltransferase
MAELAPEYFPVDGILVDLGVSSPQIDTAERGFSFMREGPLDMRMAAHGETAAELIDRLEERELADLIYTLAEESFSRPIARALKRTQPKTTQEAVRAIEQAVPRKKWPNRVHVATKTFQALRMAVNEELPSLDRLLAQLPILLRPGGVAAIISFHSLEDRRVKEAFRTLEGRCTCPPDFPVCVCDSKGSFVSLRRKAFQASDEELAENPRSRSARLRAVEKVR